MTLPNDPWTGAKGDNVLAAIEREDEDNAALSPEAATGGHAPHELFVRVLLFRFVRFALRCCAPAAVARQRLSTFVTFSHRRRQSLAPW